MSLNDKLLNTTFALAFAFLSLPLTSALTFTEPESKTYIFLNSAGANALNKFANGIGSELTTISVSEFFVITPFMSNFAPPSFKLVSEISSLLSSNSKLIFASERTKPVCLVAIPPSFTIMLPFDFNLLKLVLILVFAKT